jgi:hypothetical protein
MIMERWFVIALQPGTGKLLALVDEDGDILIFTCEGDAREAGLKNPAFEAWGFDVFVYD